MTTQTEMFPKTELDEATAVLNHLIAEEEKADKAVGNAEEKAYEASQRVLKQRHVVARLASMMPAAEPIVEGEEVADDVEDAVVLEIEGDVLDPITGEVTRPRQDHALRCPSCDSTDVHIDPATPADAGVNMGADSDQATAVCDTCGWSGWERELAAGEVVVEDDAA